mmetsp:Transcript_6169/g.9191  ORF Transcript_6169/g.9191 Transcript_6169/m.9191 type:complete len:351 (+) Transcript_6169:1272-2324(+)|eukprot:CAMPEP_0197307502 /NCGR_PEP_ID=MMETSP0891-20130614/5258_1 /TAXON_ID=44058 ORGANISM="Aureoumbra lagunensis, Strain CCMP1510" /NCGR_SAMPLE_ID=MMETSP0891 /ASSEMBLY_ACC=CAM_ASM_000534 /LENGTH=350 /DNA_ID=CAMNT_0042790921 /DNA_START=1487 /DNA_END=2539 /DNA_ORIENTATION=+
MNCLLLLQILLTTTVAVTRESVIDQIYETSTKWKKELLPTLFQRSWIVLSEFDYADPSRDILNVAYPSAIASYFVTLVPKNSRYVFKGTFAFGTGVYQINLIAYDEQGDVDPNIAPLFDHETADGTEVHMDVEATDAPKLVLQRFYVDPDIFSDQDLENMLFNVTLKSKLVDFKVPPLSKPLRTVLSNLLEGVISRAIAARAPVVTTNASIAFALPGDTSSLFPDISHVYLFAVIGPASLVTISGSFNITSTRPYFDFIVVNQNTTATDDALPFYEFIQSDGSYTISVASASYSGSVSNATIRWKTDNQFPLVLMRIITYDYNVVNYTGPLSPAQTQMLIPDIYPSAKFS